MRAAKCVMEYLLNEGVKYFFWIPGGGIAPLFNELYDYPQIKTILTQHEQGAGFMADGFYRASGIVARALEACHALGFVAERAGDIRDCLKRAFDSGKPSIIDIKIDPDEFPPGSLVRYDAGVKKFPELLTKHMPQRYASGQWTSNRECSQNEACYDKVR